MITFPPSHCKTNGFNIFFQCIYLRVFSNFRRCGRRKHSNDWPHKKGAGLSHLLSPSLHKQLVWFLDMPSLHVPPTVVEINAFGKRHWRCAVSPEISVCYSLTFVPRLFSTQLSTYMFCTVDLLLRHHCMLCYTRTVKCSFLRWVSVNCFKPLCVNNSINLKVINIF